MSARAEALAMTIQHAMPLFERFFPGFDDSNRTTQPPALPNHAAWTLGHLGVTATRAVERLAGHDTPQDLPASDFVAGDGRAGDAVRFDSESVCYGSVPVDDPAIYPAWDRCVEIYRASHLRLIEATRGASDSALERPVPWGSGRMSAEQLVHRMVFHLGTHTGQLVDLRRALGLGQLIG